MRSELVQDQAVPVAPTDECAHPAHPAVLLVSRTHAGHEGGVQDGFELAGRGVRVERAAAHRHHVLRPARVLQAVAEQQQGAELGVACHGVGLVGVVRVDAAAIDPLKQQVGVLARESVAERGPSERPLIGDLHGYGRLVGDALRTPSVPGRGEGLDVDSRIPGGLRCGNSREQGRWLRGPRDLEVRQESVHVLQQPTVPAVAVEVAGP